MREIKFRARNVVAPRCWIYGYFVIEQDCCYIINDKGRFKVRAGTQSQYTGLKDKNDKEIYEGDVIRNENYSIIGEIKWVEGNAEYICYHATGWCKFTNEYVVEVIGNIYENPELLSDGVDDEV